MTESSAMQANRDSVRAPATATFHIPSLDGIRAISFMLVFVAHCGFDDIVPGGLGVTVFFFLSGFLITTLMRQEYDRNGRLHLSHFWLRRIFRILPPFYLVLGFAYCLPLLSGHFNTANAYALLAQATHITNYWIIGKGYEGFPEFTGTGVYWSLAVEEHFYLVFPFIYIALRRMGASTLRQALTLGVMCAAVLLWRIVLHHQAGVSINRTYMGTDTRLDSILFGCLLAVWQNPMVDERRGSAQLWAFLLLPLGALGIVASLLIRDEAFRETLRYSLQGLALIPLFSAAIRYPDWWVFRWLNLRPLVKLGALSYALYLVHLGVIYTVRDALHVQSSVMIGIVAFVIALSIALALHKFVEKPFAALRRRLAD